MVWQILACESSEGAVCCCWEISARVKKVGMKDQLYKTAQNL